MPSLAAISKVDFPFKVDQQEVKKCAKDLFAPSFPQVERMMSAFDNTEIKIRNFCKPLQYYSTVHTFQEQNAEYIRISLEYSVRAIVSSFLEKHHLTLSEIKNFIFHPGGKKILTAYEEALSVGGDFLKNTREVMNDYGNMSSPSVLYVLERFFSQGFENGYGLMLTMGPGFSSEMALLQMKNN